MSTTLKLLILAVLIAGGLHMLHDTPHPAPGPEEEQYEESEKKQAWIRAMLRDPLTGEIPEGIRMKELQFYRHLQHSVTAYYKKTRGVHWNSRGPWNVGGRTRSIAIDVTNENHLVTGGVSGGIWQSWDAGSTWTKVSDSNAHPGVVSIAQDMRPGKTHIWYALSGEIYGTSASGGNAFYLGDGAFISLDNANTWKPLAATAVGNPNEFSTSYQGGWRIVCSPVDTVPTCTYMATYGTIFRSTDTGKTWKAVLGAGNASYFSDVAVTSGGIVYASLSSGGAIKGFWRSANGVNFVNITPSFLKSHDRTVIGIDPDNENTVYFLSELPSDTSGGVKTSNYEGTPEYVSLARYTYVAGDGTGNGGSWTDLSPNLPVTASGFDKFNTQGGYDLFVRPQPGTNNVFIGGTNIYRSTDGFTTPDNITQIGGYGISTTLPNFTAYPNHHPDQHDLVFLTSGSQKAYSVSDGGVKYTADINAASVAWVEKSLGYITSQLYTVNIDESKPFDPWLLGGFQDNGNYISASNASDASWDLTINGDGAYNYIAPGRAFYVISTQQGNVRKVLLDERGKVIRRKRIDPAGFDKSMYNFINALVVDPKDHNTLYLPIGKKIARLDKLRDLEVVHNTDKLTTGWTIFPDTISTVNFDGEPASITAVAMSKTQPNILYVGTSNKELYRVMDPGSATPQLKKCGIGRLPPSGSYISDIAVDPDSAHCILVCYSNYANKSLYYSSDTGNTWYYVGGNLESTLNFSGAEPSVRCVEILVDANGKRHYFAGTSIGLYSTDSLVFAISNATNKTVWQQESPGKIGAAVVTDIKVRRGDGYVVAATHGNGIFEAYYFGATAPATPVLGNTLEIYPNPAHEHLYYTFSNDTAGTVYAEILDMSGRRVATVLNEFFNSGTYTVKVNLANMSNGHYFLALYGKNKKPLVKHFVVLRS